MLIFFQCLNIKVIKVLSKFLKLFNLFYSPVYDGVGGRRVDDLKDLVHDAQGIILTFLLSWVITTLKQCRFLIIIETLLSFVMLFGPQK